VAHKFFYNFYFIGLGALRGEFGRLACNNGPNMYTNSKRVHDIFDAVVAIVFPGAFGAPCPAY